MNHPHDHPLISFIFVMTALFFMACAGPQRSVESMTPEPSISNTKDNVQRLKDTPVATELEIQETEETIATPSEPPQPTQEALARQSASA